jgi:hypothetical protein
MIIIISQRGRRFFDFSTEERGVVSKVGIEILMFITLLYHILNCLVFDKFWSMN